MTAPIDILEIALTRLSAAQAEASRRWGADPARLRFLEAQEDLAAVRGVMGALRAASQEW